VKAEPDICLRYRGMKNMRQQRPEKITSLIKNIKIIKYKK